jgi:YggT family protein
VNGLLCQIDLAIVLIARGYSVLLIIYAVLSWLPDLRGPWVRYIAMFIEPILTPLRRIIPPLGGLDLSFLVLLLVLNLLIVPMLGNAANSACAAPY